MRIATPKLKGPKPRKKRRNDIAQRLCDMADKRGPYPTDVLGSYTGTPKGGGEPVQDADDL